MYRNIFNFCIFFFYPVTLLTSLTSSRSLFVYLLRFSTSCHLQLGQFISLFQSACCLLPSLALITQTGTFSTVWSKSCESKHPCFGLNFREKVFRQLCSLWVFVDALYLVSLYSYFSESFLLWWEVEFIKCFFYIFIWLHVFIL